MILSLTYHWPELSYVVMLNDREGLEIEPKSWNSIIKLKVENEYWEVIINLCHSRTGVDKLVSSYALSNMAATNHLGYWAVKIWQVPTEMYYKCKIYTGFQKLSMKKRM